jgi:hypothetical protein
MVQSEKKETFNDVWQQQYASTESAWYVQKDATMNVNKFFKNVAYHALILTINHLIITMNFICFADLKFTSNFKLATPLPMLGWLTQHSKIRQ